MLALVYRRVDRLVEELRKRVSSDVSGSSPPKTSRLQLSSQLHLSMDNPNNYQVFRECLSAAIVEKSEDKPIKSSKRRRPKRATSSSTPPRTDPEDLAEFIDVLQSTISNRQELHPVI